MKRWKSFGIGVIVAVILCDQWLKYWVVQHIPLGATRFQNPLIDLTYLQNRGAAWSILSGKRWFLIALTLIITVVLAYFLMKANNAWLIMGLSLAIGGALGNFIDRIRLGYVVDMFQLECFDFPIFNLADVALFCGVCCLFIYLIYSDQKGRQ